MNDLLILHAYGELEFDQEEAVDLHLASCPPCSAVAAQLRQLHGMVDDAAADPPFELLSACRQQLHSSLRVLPARRPFWRRWISDIPRLPQTVRWAAGVMTAAALIGAGFAGGRLVPPSAAAIASVRSIRQIDPSGDGRVRIVYDEVRRHEIAGRIDDRPVREMLLAATRDPDDPGVRVDSVEYLRTRCEREEVRAALIRALASDPNEGVRLRALEALKPYAGDGEVRSALTRILISDRSAMVRSQTIDLLVASRRHEAELAGVLQGLMRREQNSYVLQRGQSALRAMNASLETF